MASKEPAAVAETLGDQMAVEWLRCALGLNETQTPFPWQITLLQRFRRGEIVSSLDIPTGLGKTAVMAVWLVARALGAALPRRLVYVVDRRAVVDQATEVAESICVWAAKERTVADSLGLADRPLPISTLRGQHVDNRAWLEDPSLPAIIVGTIDMIGSRLLFSGYGVSPKMRPYHAGLLGADTLVVLDEAHLVPPFEGLLRHIECGTEAFRPRDPSLRKLIPAFKVLSLSATGRQPDSTAQTLTDTDWRHPIVLRRLTAKKRLGIVELATLAQVTDATERGERIGAGAEDETSKKSKEPKLASVLAKKAWELTRCGSASVRCLVFCDARKDAIAVAAELRNLVKSTGVNEGTVELFVGGRRVKERTQARDELIRLGFLAGTDVKLERATFLVATSAGEVGVDLDADHMVCDLVAWERMVQRLGRVNRRGDGDAEVIVVVGREPMPSDGTKKALEKRDASRAASKQVEELAKKLSTLQDERKAAPKGQGRSAEAKAAEEKRRATEKDLKKSLSAQQKRIKAFKDADAKIVARHEADVVKYTALRKLLDTVGEGGSLSPESLLQLRQRQHLAKTLRDATTVEPLRPELTRALIDAWSMTSLEEHAGRPDVDPWLRGFRPNDPPQTTVVWRRHLPVPVDRDFDEKAAKRFFEAAPLHVSEKLETETHLALEWVIERATALRQAKGEGSLPAATAVVAIVLTRRDVKGLTLAQLASPKGNGKQESKEDKKAREHTLEQLRGLLSGATLVIDARLGGLANGLLDHKADGVAGAADDESTPWLTRRDAVGVPVTGFHVRLLRAGGDGEAGLASAVPDPGWVRRYRFMTAMAEGDPVAVLAVDGWGRDAATEEERAEADREQSLDQHQSWAAECARAIAQRVGLDNEYQALLALAARLHDEGKRASRWQRAFKAPVAGRPYAKTRGPIDFDILDGYRHELGSLPCVEEHIEFRKLSEDEKELVLHLIAAHHGYARPVIGTSGCDDAPPSIVEERARQVALRFARLSRRWGPWGLAWWEALLRAADQAASRRNQQASAALPAQQVEA